MISRTLRMFFLSILALCNSFKATAQELEMNTFVTLRAADNNSAWLAISNAPADFTVEASEDLRGWQILLAIHARKPAFEVVDRDVSSNSEHLRFYRTRETHITVEQQASKWSASTLFNYRFRFKRTCFCQ